MRITAKGRVTLSADMTPRDFESVFGAPLTEVPPKPPGKTDFGHAGGAIAGDLNIPVPLQEFVQSISVAPPHLRF